MAVATATDERSPGVKKGQRRLVSLGAGTDHRSKNECHEQALNSPFPESVVQS